MKSSCFALVCIAAITLGTLGTVSVLGDTQVGEFNGRNLHSITADLVNGRKLSTYSGCSEYVCTKDNGNGTSTTCTDAPGYKGCTTYPNGEKAGRKLLSLTSETVVGRALKAYSGCSSGDWGSVCTKDNGNGTSTTCTKTPYYNGCSTYPNGE